MWKTLALLLPVMGWLRLAFSQGMVTRVPVLLGLERTPEAQRLCGAAGWLQVANGLIFAAATFAFSFVVADAWQWPMRLMAFVLAASQVHNFYRDVAIAHQNSAARGRGLFLAALTDSVLAIALGSVWGLPGFALGALIGFVVPAVYLRQQAPRELRLRFSLESIKSLGQAGWRAAVIDIAQTARRYSDVAMVALLGGPAATGLYALSQMALEAGLNLTRVSINEVISPRLLRQASREGSLEGVVQAAHRASRQLLLLLPPVILAAGFLLEPMVQWLLPKYAAGVPAARLMLWAILFAALQAIAQPVLIAAHRLSAMVWMVLGLLPLAAAAQYLLWRAGAGLLGVAAVSVAAQAILASASAWLAVRAQSDSSSRRQLIPQC
jgi:O-antigen/teichoic acid export membrane protein